MDPKLTSDERLRSIGHLVDDLFRHVLFDEDPIFIGDEATMFDVSLASAEELIVRCRDYYGVRLAITELSRPLWQLLPELDRARQIRTTKA